MSTMMYTTTPTVTGGYVGPLSVVGPDRIETCDVVLPNGLALTYEFEYAAYVDDDCVKNDHTAIFPNGNRLDIGNTYERVPLRGQALIDACHRALAERPLYFPRYKAA